MLHNPNLFHSPSSVFHPPPITPIFKKKLQEKKLESSHGHRILQRKKKMMGKLKRLQCHAIHLFHEISQMKFQKTNKNKLKPMNVKKINMKEL
jgi:hypothetical protein